METDYLLKSTRNAKRLHESLTQLKKRQQKAAFNAEVGAYLIIWPCVVNFSFSIAFTIICELTSLHASTSQNIVVGVRVSKFFLLHITPQITGAMRAPASIASELICLVMRMTRFQLIHSILYCLPPR